jgi:hypothetical protein
MKGIVIAATLAAAAAVSGCAGFEFRSDAMLTGPEQGLKLYTPKPYVLVARQGGESKPVDVSIVYLPDLAHPYYAKARSGWGSSNLTMKVTDGMLTEFGQQVDSTAASTLTSVGSLLTAAAGLRTKEVTRDVKKPLEFSLYEIDNTAGTTILREVMIPDPATAVR